MILALLEVQGSQVPLASQLFLETLADLLTHVIQAALECQESLCCLWDLATLEGQESQEDHTLQELRRAR